VQGLHAARFALQTVIPKQGQSRITLAVRQIFSDNNEKLFIIRRGDTGKDEYIGTQEDEEHSSVLRKILF
jgi:hypothetical protein